MSKGKTMRLTVGNRTFRMLLDDCPLAEEIASMCPFESEFSRFGGHEYYAELPSRPSSSGSGTSKTFSDCVYYFEGWNAFSIVYGDADIAPFEVVRIGEMEDSIAAMLRGAGSSVLIRCEMD